MATERIVSIEHPRVVDGTECDEDSPVAPFGDSPDRSWADGDWESVVSLSASSPGVAVVIATWQPSQLPAEEIEWLTPHMERIRRWVVALGPSSESYAGYLLYAASRVLLLAERHFGVTDDESVLNPVTINELVAYALPDMSDGSKLTFRSSLRAIGRAVNPHLFEPPLVPLRAPEVKAAYTPTEERNFRIAAGLSGYRTVVERKWTLAGGCGAGLNGQEIRRAEVGDLVPLVGGRVAVQVHGKKARLVPIRTDYTALALEAAEAAQEGRFFTARGANATYDAASRLCDGLSLRRARSTWLTAHLRAGTAPPVLRVIAGGVSEKTLRELSARIESEMTPHDAALQGLKP